MKDFYSILGIDENATPQDIKKAFREKSKQFHPDVNPNGEDAFKEIMRLMKFSQIHRKEVSMILPENLGEILI